MERYTRYVDVFLGSGTIDLPKPQGVAAAWHFIKGLAGNTTPAAALPFGKMTACAYSGGYSAGYGHNGINCGEPVRTIMGPGTIRGFSHIHQSGTGYIDTFYNYAVTAPFYGDQPETAFEPERMTDEDARPGYYAAGYHGVKCEMTVTRQAAHHRYTFPRAGGRVAIDFTNDGLLEERTRGVCENLRCRVVAPDTVECEAELQGVRICFCVRCPGTQARIWEKGCVFECTQQTCVRLAMGLSPRSMDCARRGAEEAERDFDEIAGEASRAWDEALSAIEVEADDERALRIFYSNFYHTLIKPSDWNGESFYYDDEEAFVLDFATLWDQYKTQMPLLFTLYPDMAQKITRTILAHCRARGQMPHTLLLDRRSATAVTSQAKMLAEHVLADAYYRGVPMDMKRVAEEIRRDVLPEDRFADYKTRGVCDAMAHTIDVADGCHASAEMARAAGDGELAEQCEAWAKMWVNAFDGQTGLLRSTSHFYEGTHWNYSFRLLHDMDTRLRLAGGKEAYAKLLDRFFGFTHAQDVSGRFEGFNNETDMETPYAYHYADRHDRICEVIHDGMRSMFCEGRGGIPGNNDSGGLSSMYLWNVMGIFPVSGQDRMLIGSPLLRRAVLHLASGRDFTICREGTGIYVRRAVWNGQPLERFEMRASDMMRGGTLVLTMTDEPVRTL